MTAKCFIENLSRRIGKADINLKYFIKNKNDRSDYYDNWFNFFGQGRILLKKYL